MKTECFSLILQHSIATKKTPEIRNEQKKFVSRRLQHLSDTTHKFKGPCASRVPGICERALQLNGVNDQQNRGRGVFQGPCHIPRMSNETPLSHQ